MSNQAGIWHYDRRPISQEQLDAIELQLSVQGPDCRGDYSEPGLAMLHRAFHITREDAQEKQPLRGANGSVLTWDGRLDNRDELLATMGRSHFDLPTDVEVVDAVLSASDIEALHRLNGDWALVRWNRRERRLLLARDYIGMRKLYYIATATSFYWSTDLAALVLNSGEHYTLCDSYFAGYFASNPSPQLTPYQQIKMVPPGGYIEVMPGQSRVGRYWSFNSSREIHYKSDADYEAHFRHLFRQSVQRRLRTDYPLLVDLSGGLDSSSIVCMANEIIKSGSANAIMNTLSKYSLEEPGGDERPYFNAVEAHVGKTGVSIEVRPAKGDLYSALPGSLFAPLPCHFSDLCEEEKVLLDRTTGQQNRVHLSGFGGDELLGGVQDPVPLLAFRLWRLRLPSFWRELEAWSLQRKTTIWALFAASARQLMPVVLRASLHRDSSGQVAAWLTSEFRSNQQIERRRLQIAPGWRDWLPGPTSPDTVYFSLASTISGDLPHFAFAEQLALPYYDRDLFEFLFSIPGEQLLRPKQRRSLMRRALKGIVPDQVLSRRTKWLGRQVPTRKLLATAKGIAVSDSASRIVRHYVDQTKLYGAFQQMEQGVEQPLLQFIRYYGMVLLVDDLCRRGLVKDD